MSLYKFPLLELSINNLNYSDIPIVENTRLNTYIVKIKQLSEFIENYGLNLDEGLEILKETNNIDSISISVDEATLIENPWLLNSDHRIVVSRLCEDSELYKITNLVLTEYFENQNSKILDIYLESKNMNELIYVLNEKVNLVKSTDKNSNNGFMNQLSQVGNSISQTYNNAKQELEKKVGEFGDKFDEYKKEGIEKLNNLSPGLGDKAENMVGTVKDTVKSGIKTAGNAVENAKDFAKENPVKTAAAVGTIGAIGAGLSKMFGGSSNNNQTAKDPSFLARKLAAIKNWMNQNFGTSFNIDQNALNWKPQNASVENKYYKGISINEIYRPRRKYHVRYL